MSAIYAMIVGIDAYDQPDWTMAGPCANACAIADLVLTMTEPDRVFLFIEPRRGELEAEIAEYERQGVHVTRSGGWQAIDDCRRATLRTNIPPDSRLFVYWSGHGFTDPYGSRILICHDYTEAMMNNRVFDATGFLRHLRSSAYASFTEHLFLADVCGNYSGRFETPGKAPDEPLSRRQTAFFASPEGDYAHDENGMGVFTRVARDVLRAHARWPEQKAFSDDLQARLAVAGAQPFRINVFSDGEALCDRLIGSLARPTGNAHLRSVSALLADVELPDSVFRPHYLRVVSDLGQPRLASAQGLSGMLAELASLQDAAASGGVPYGLLQFLVRLTAELELETVINPWLEAHAVGQANALATIREKLGRERQRKVLVVDVATDELGALNGFRGHLFTRDLMPVAGVDLQPHQVADWGNLAVCLEKDLDLVRANPLCQDLEIHVLVDAPLFDYPVHRLPLKNGRILGDAYVVILRHRTRVLSADWLIFDAWQEYADALRPTNPKVLKLIETGPAAGAGELLPAEKGFCYTPFTLPPPADRASDTTEKRILSTLLDLGVPYLYRLHANADGAASGPDLEAILRQWLETLPSLDRFPAKLAVQRRNRNVYAQHGTLLWDDPQFIPLLGSQGVALK